MTKESVESLVRQLAREGDLETWFGLMRIAAPELFLWGDKETVLHIIEDKMTLVFRGYAWGHIPVSEYRKFIEKCGLTITVVPDQGPNQSKAANKNE